MKGPRIRIPLDFPMGLFLGAVSVAAIVVLGNAVTTEQWATVYAALIGGIFAVVAVWGAFYGVSMQVRAQAELLDQQRLARLEAERASLLMVLSDLIEVCEQRVNFLILPDEKLKEDRWTISSETLEALKACVEYSRGDFQKQLSDLIGIYQLCRDRSDHFHAREQSPSLPFLKIAVGLDRLHRIMLMQEWVVLRQRATALFNGARGQYTNYSEISVFNGAIGWLEAMTDRGFQSRSKVVAHLLIDDQDYLNFLSNAKLNRRLNFTDDRWRERR